MMVMMVVVAVAVVAGVGRVYQATSVGAVSLFVSTYSTQMRF